MTRDEYLKAKFKLSENLDNEEAHIDKLRASVYQKYWKELHALEEEAKEAGVFYGDVPF